MCEITRVQIIWETICNSQQQMISGTVLNESNVEERENVNGIKGVDCGFKFNGI